jgi:hypothetical protein
VFVSPLTQSSKTLAPTFEVHASENEKTNKDKFSLQKKEFKMKYYFTLFSILSFVLKVNSQSSSELKNQLLDSLLTSKIDTFFIIKTACSGCGNSIQSPVSEKKSSCSYFETYYVFWLKNSKKYYKAFNNCYETQIINTNKIEWLTYYFEHQTAIKSVREIEKHKSILVKNDTLNYAMNCLDLDTIPPVLGEYDYLYKYFQLEIKLNGEFYNSGEINEYSLCSFQTRNLTEIKVMNEFYNKLKENLFSIQNNELEESENKILKNWCCD